MRRLVVAVFVAALALTLVGCGGGAEEQAAAPDTTAQTPATPPPAPTGDTADATQVMSDRSNASAEVFELLPSGEGVPEAVIDRLNRDQAMLLFFYNSAQDVTNDTRKQVDKVAEDNTGLVDLLTYDLGKYTKVDSSGVVQVDEEKLQADAKGQQAVRFAHEIGVDGAPYIVVVDEQGYEIFWARGFIDAELLDRQVQRVSQ